MIPTSGLSMSARDAELRDQFFDAVLSLNPFSTNRVTSMDDRLVDVAGIHEDKFAKLCRLTEQVFVESREARQASAVGVVLQAGAGVGKSHLLSKLCRWARREKKACYVYLHNVMASPERMSRHFLRSVMSALIRERESYKESMLYRLVQSAMAAICAENNLPRRQLSPETAWQAFQERMANAGLREDRINAQVVRVLFKFFEVVNLNPEVSGPAREPVDAVIDWLSGDSITPEAAADIGLTVNPRDRDEDGQVRLADDHHIEQVMLILCSLANVAGRTFLVCVDQFDNLAEDQVKGFARFLHALLDNAKNLLLVISGVSETMEFFREQGIISEAQWDRLARHEFVLHRIRGDLARALVSERLADIRERYVQATDLRPIMETQQFFPISEKDFEKQFGEQTAIRPRDVITWADKAWQREQDRLSTLGGMEWLKTWNSGPMAPLPPPEQLIRQKVSQTLNDYIAERRDDAGALPPDADNMAMLVQRLLETCVDRPEYSLVTVERGPKKGACQLRVSERPAGGGQPVTTGMCFVASTNGRSVSASLTKLLAESRCYEHLILITDEERKPLPLKDASKTKQLHEELKSLGTDRFLHIPLSFQQYVELDALRSVIDGAGDLEIEMAQGGFRPLEKAEVIGALHQLGSYLAHPVLNEALVEPPQPHAPAPLPLPQLSDDDIRTCIAGNLGFCICITTNNVTEKVLSRVRAAAPPFEIAHEQVIRVVAELERNGKIHVKDLEHGKLLMSTPV